MNGPFALNTNIFFLFIIFLRDQTINYILIIQQERRDNITFFLE